MHSFSENSLQTTSSPDAAQLLVACLLMLFMLYSSLRFGQAVLSLEGRRQRLWMVAAAALAGFGRFTVQLTLLRVVAMPKVADYSAAPLVAALLFAVCGRFLSFECVAGQALRLRKLVACGVAEAATILAAQALLLRSARMAYVVPLGLLCTLAGLCALACVVAEVAAAGILRRPPARWERLRILYAVATVAGIFGLRHLIIHLADVSRVHRTLLPPQPHTLQVPGMVLQLSPFLAVVLLCCAHVSLFLYWRGVRWHNDLLEADRRQQIASALAEQRAMRMEKEELLKEIRVRKQAEARLAASAFTDSVTGLRNRLFLSDRLRTLMRRKGRRTLPRCALLYLDLDHFKAVNDMLGHVQADRILMEVAARIQECLHEKDLAARLGGDEFAILLHAVADEESAVRTGQRLLAVLERPMERAGNTFHLSASIGLCLVESTSSDPEVIVRNADLAMYCAKREGGGRVVPFVASMHTEAIKALQDRAALKQAIEREEFVMWYQPLVDMETKEIGGMEALIRWEHPERGLVQPCDFIPLAEATGHIVEIGNWVLRRACLDHAVLQANARQPLLLSLNVSTQQLERGDFLDLLQQTMEQTSMPPHQLQLEITESILLGEPLRMGALFEQIRCLGVKVAFDDFGTGYSSLSYIQRFPVDTLKIDQSFVRSVQEGSVNLKIIQLMMDLSRATGMGISAEGVETESEEVLLLQLGCRVAQGYLYSRPVPIEGFKALLERKQLLLASNARMYAA